MNRPIAIRNAHPRLRLPRAAVTRAIRLLDGQFSIPPGELSVVFLPDPTLARIHADFMADPTPTDVITFGGDPLAGLAGEICVSVDTAARYVGLYSVAALERSDKVATLSAGSLKRGYGQERLRTLQEKFATELTLYLVHGWLHLAGYDDLQPVKKRRMRAAETRAMKVLRAAQAIPAFRLG